MVPETPLPGRGKTARIRHPSGPPKFHSERLSGCKLKYLAPYKRFRGIDIPWDEPLQLAAATERVAKASRSRKVVKLAAGQFGSPLELYVKRYNYKTWLGPYLRAARKSRAREEFELGWRLMERGIQTPRPVWLAEAEGALSPFSILATEAIPESENVIERWRRLTREADREALLTAVGRFCLLLHERGLFHDDCKASHILTLPDAPFDPVQFFIIDLLGCSILKRISAYRRAKNLYQVLRSFKPKHTSFGFTMEHRLVFLEAYGGSAGEAEKWSRWVDRIGRLKGRMV